MNTRLLIRMTAPVAVTSLLLLAVGVGAAWQLHVWQQNLSQELQANVSGVRAAEELEIVTREIRSRLEHYRATRQRAFLDSVTALRPDVEHWLAEAERWSITPREQELMARVRRGKDHFFGELGKLGRPSPVSPPAPAVGEKIDRILTQEMLDPTHRYLDFNEEEVEASITKNEAFTDRVVWVLVVVGTCGSAAGLLAGVAFARGFSRSLVQLSVPVRAAAGQLDEVVGPVTLPPGADLHELEGMLRQIAERTGAVVERLRRSEREALRAEQLAAVGQMAAGMAHELRNPLTSMKLLVQGAMTDENWEGVTPGPSLAGRDLRILEEEITRLERLMQLFLDYARPAAPEKRALDVKPLAEQAIALVAARAAAARVHIALEAPPEPVQATVDQGQMRQVLLNLLLNAVDALAGGGEVRVELAADACGLTLQVTDNGPGFAAGLGESVFAPFVTTKETGLGLGLSICKRIVEAHGGTITAANRPEGGAVVRVQLPAAGR